MNLTREAWNQFIIEAGGSFLQSWEWGDLQERLGRRILRIGNDGFHALLIERKLPLGQTYWYVPRGPVFKHGESTAERLVSLVAAAKTNADGGLLLRLEPDSLNMPTPKDALRGLGFHEVPPTQPNATRILDLKLSETKLLNEMEHDTRYAIRIAAKRGVTIRIHTDKHDKQSVFPTFWKLFEATNDRHSLRTYPKSYYEAVSELDGELKTAILIAYVGQTPINASIIAFYGKTGIYLHSGSQKGHGRLNAPSLSLWEAIKAAKGLGCTIFDLWGVDRENPRWKGITAFKESFGGRDISYPGTWDYPLHGNNKYRLYRLARSVRTVKRGPQ